PGATSGPVAVLVSNATPPVEVSNEIFFEVLDPSQGALRLAAQAAPTGAPALSRALAVSPDGNLVAVGGQGGELYLLDAEAGSPTFNQFINSATPLITSLVDIAIAQDGQRAFVVSSGGDLIPIVNINRHSPDFGAVADSIDLAGTGAGLERLAVSPDGFFLLASDPGLSSVHIIDIRPGSSLENQVIASTLVSNTSLGLNGSAREMAFHPGGEFAYLAIADDSPAVIEVLNTNPADPAFGTIVDTLFLPTGAPDEVPVSLSFTPDGSRCFVMTAQQTGAPNRTVVTLGTTAPATPTIDFIRPFPTASAAVDEHIHVSPRGDRAVLNILSDGFSHIDIATSPTLTVLDQLAGALHTSEIDFDYTPDAARLYATGSARDTVFVYDFSAALTLAQVSGDNQTGIINQALSAPLRVEVLDSGTASPGVPVSFEVAAGGGFFTTSDPMVNPTTLVVATDSDGIAEVNWTMGPVIGSSTQAVEATSLGLGGSPTTFVASTLDDPDLLPLTISIIVPDSNETDVSITTAIQVTFSRSVDTTTVDNTTYFLREKLSSTLVPTILGSTDSNRKLSLTPVDPLQPETIYTIVITTGLKDTSSGALVAGATADFTTTPPPPLELVAASPPAAVTNDPVVLSGTGFDPAPGNNTVLFNDVPGVVTDAGNDFIVVTIPLSATTGEVRVVVGPDTSNALPFTVLIPTSTASDEVLSTVGTGSSTRSLSITPDGALAYAVSPDANTVVPIDLVGFTTFSAVPTGDHPFAIVILPDGSLAYVVNLFSGTVTIIGVDIADPATFNQVVETVIVGTNPVDIVASPDGDRVFVANLGSNDLSVIDADSTSSTFNSVLSTVGTGSTTRSISITPDGTRLYVGTDTGYIVMDALDFGVLSTVGTGSGTRSISITPDGTLAVLLTTEGDVLIFDIAPGSPSENEVLSTVGTGSGTRSISITPDGSLLYLIQVEGDIIIVVSLDVGTSVGVLEPDAAVTILTATIIDTITTVGEDPSHVAFDPSGSGRAVVTNAGDNTITILGSLGFLAGRVFADCPVPDSGLLGVTIDAFAAGSGDLRAGFVTNGNGDYFGGLAPGDYTITIVKPLGYSIASQEVPITISVGDTAVVDFALTCVPIIAQPRGIGFWKHQIGIATGGIGVAEIDASTLCDHLDLIAARFNSNAINQVIVYQPPTSDECDDKLNVAKDLLNLRGSSTMIDRAKQQLVTLLLNVAAVHISLTEFISEDSATVSQAITYCDELIDDRDSGNDEKAKNIAEMINNAVIISAGTIPLSTANIAYASDRIPRRFALGQNYPNPFNPTTTIRFDLPVTTHVRLKIYDVMGRLVATLVNEKKPAGIHTIVWDRTSRNGGSVASGVYFYRLEAGAFRMTRKMVLLK
ncbi:MAG: beta-propeller fold lactonase family protein, partial [Candidatus Krumholzibacteria bacterium]